jgi:hypothetical protein
VEAPTFSQNSGFLIVCSIRRTLFCARGEDTLGLRIIFLGSFRASMFPWVQGAEVNLEL